MSKPARERDSGRICIDVSVDGETYAENYDRRGVGFHAGNHSPRDDLSHITYPENTAGFAQVAFLVGLEIANEPARPTWVRGDFFGEMFGKGRRGATP